MLFPRLQVLVWCHFFDTIQVFIMRILRFFNTSRGGAQASDWNGWNPKDVVTMKLDYVETNVSHSCAFCSTPASFK